MAKQRTGTPSTNEAHSSLLERSVTDSKEIAILAYRLWQARGCPEGSPEIDWLEAEKQLRSRPEVAPASPQKSEPILVRRSGA